MNEVLREFLLETHENLAQLDLDLVTLETDPTGRDTLARVFRTIHTVKGTAGFLGFSRLQNVSHAGENLLGRLRDGVLRFNPEIATALLGVVDAIRRTLASIEQSEQEGNHDFSALIRTLERLREGAASTESAALPPSSVPAPAALPPSTDLTAVIAGPLPGLVGAASPAPLPRPIVAVASPVTATASAPEPSEPVEPRSLAVSDSAIRVDVGLLDKLMTLVGELVLARNQIMQFSTAQEDRAFLSTVQRFNLLTTELQASVMKTRMQPIGNIWNKFPRIVRDLAVACQKQVRLEMDGQETELDKTIVEAIRDPLTHLLRNAVDHGIELPADRLASGKPAQGRLHLHAFHEGGKVIIEISDDGGGIDPQRVRAKAIANKIVTPEQAARLDERELVRLIFLPGFSTAERITHFSGRGVGMDVVRTNVEKIGGTVDVESRLGRGTTITMKIPLTLAIIPALTVTSGGDRYAIPQVTLLELVRLEGDQARKAIERIHGTPVYRLRGKLLPLVYLDRQFHGNSAVAPDSRANGEVNIVVLQADDRQFGLIVDAIHETEEIVVKPLQKLLKGIGVFAGATIMGDGTVALIIDVPGLALHANVVTGVRERVLNESAVAAADAGERETALLFAGPDGGRMAVPLSLVARLEEFPRSAVERVGAQDVVQYRGEIMPLIHVARVLGRQRPRRHRAPRRRRPNTVPATSDAVQVVVYAGSGRSSTGQRVGLVVDRILDIVEETIVSRARANRPGVLFTAVIQGRVTEFLDVAGIIRSADPAFFEDAQVEAEEMPSQGVAVEA